MEDLYDLFSRLRELQDVESKEQRDKLHLDLYSEGKLLLAQTPLDEMNKSGLNDKLRYVSLINYIDKAYGPFCRLREEVEKIQSHQGELVVLVEEFSDGSFGHSDTSIVWNVGYLGSPGIEPVMRLRCSGPYKEAEFLMNFKIGSITHLKIEDSFRRKNCVEETQLHGSSPIMRIHNKVLLKPSDNSSRYFCYLQKDYGIWHSQGIYIGEDSALDYLKDTFGVSKRGFDLDNLNQRIKECREEEKNGRKSICRI